MHARALLWKRSWCEAAHAGGKEIRGDSELCIDMRMSLRRAAPLLNRTTYRAEPLRGSEGGRNSRNAKLERPKSPSCDRPSSIRPGRLIILVQLPSHFSHLCQASRLSTSRSTGTECGRATYRINPRSKPCAPAAWVSRETHACTRALQRTRRTTRQGRTR